jgi:hypothetical protein
MRRRTIAFRSHTRGETVEDKQLERLYDYTKFHIGIYLSAAGGLAALISAAAAGSAERSYFASLVGSPLALAASFGFMVAAGIAGAVVATSTIESASYKAFLIARHGAYGLNPFSGKAWVTIEHASFWLSLLCLAIGIFSAPAVAKWL